MHAKFIALVFLIILASPAAAHPGIGIVTDKAGNIFYTDLVHVWRIAPDGRRSIAVRDVHSHELAIDANGVLFGEDSKYMGGEKWRHRVWRREPNGRVRDVIPWRDGFWREYGFVRDASGAMFWTRCPDRVCTIRRRAADGTVRTVPVRKKFQGQIGQLSPAPSGGLYVIDAGALKLLSHDGASRTIVSSIGESPMGMLPDGKGGVYIAVYVRRAIVHVTSEGRVTTVARTPAPWGPSGVAIAANGDFLILEYSTSNAARVRRIPSRGPAVVYP